MKESESPGFGIIENSVPILLGAACVGLAGLFVQVAKLDSYMSTVVRDIQELKIDSKDRINRLEIRVRDLEMKGR